jgi:hypothetical protein
LLIFADNQLHAAAVYSFAKQAIAAVWIEMDVIFCAF